MPLRELKTEKEKTEATLLLSRVTEEHVQSINEILEARKEKAAVDWPESLPPTIKEKWLTPGW